MYIFTVGSGSKVYNNQARSFLTLPLKLLCWNFSRSSVFFRHKSPNSGFPYGSDGKESACNAGNLCLTPGSGRSPGEGNGNLLQYSCLEKNPMERGDLSIYLSIYLSICIDRYIEIDIKG